MPELPQIAAQAGIELPGWPRFPRPQVEPGAASRAAETLGQSAGNQITELAVRLNEIRRDTQFNMAATDYDTRSDMIAHNLLRDPKFRSDPVALQSEFQKQVAPINEQMRQQYPAADWDGRLTRNMGLWSARKSDLLAMHGFTNQVEDTEKEGDVYAVQAQIGASDPSKDPADRAAIAQHFRDWVGRQQARGLYTQGAADQLVTKFDVELRDRNFDQFARDNPGNVLAMTKPPEGILPEKLVQAKKAAIDQLESQGKAIDAQVAAQRGQLEAQIVQATATGQPTDGMLNDYMAHGGRQEFYQAFTGEKWIESNPSLVRSFTDRLNLAKPDDIPFIMEEAAMMRGSQTMSSADLATVAKVGIARKAQGMDAQKAAEAQGWADLLGEYRPAGKMGGMPDFGPKVDETRLRATWEAALLNNGHDVTKAKEQVDKELDAYKRKGDKALKGAVGRLIP